MKKIINTYKNATIKGKVLLLAFVLILLAAALGVNGCVSVLYVNGEYTTMYETAAVRKDYSEQLEKEVIKLQRDINGLLVESEIYDDDTATKDKYDNIKKDIDGIKGVMASYIDNFENDNTLTDEAKANLMKNYDHVMGTMPAVEKSVETLNTACMNDNANDVKKAQVEIDDEVTKLVQYCADVYDAALKREVVLIDGAAEATNMSTMITVALFVIILLISVILSIRIAS